jgi:hypothetical protein
MVTGYSILPLRIATVLSLVFMVFGFVYLAVVLVRFQLYGSPVQGWPTLASLISLLSGTQLLVLGILGEYLGRIHLRMLESPPYAVRSRTAEAESGAPPRIVSPESLLCELEWDSRFFNLRIARVQGDRLSADELAEIERLRARAGLRLPLLPRRSRRSRTLARVAAAGWRFVDVRTTLRVKLDGVPAARPLDDLRPADSRDIPALRALAEASHVDSRFYQDGRFRRALCDRLFAEWIERCVEGALADNRAGRGGARRAARLRHRASATRGTPGRHRALCRGARGARPRPRRRAPRRSDRLGARARRARARGGHPGFQRPRVAGLRTRRLHHPAGRVLVPRLALARTESEIS